MAQGKQVMRSPPRGQLAALGWSPFFLRHSEAERVTKWCRRRAVLLDVRDLVRVSIEARVRARARARVKVRARLTSASAATGGSMRRRRRDIACGT